jgi:NAD(P)-dependent dehydrogenase (short-subunit alcohol dehydrogenase family)
VNINRFDLTGKVMLITGGNSGLGLGFARGIAEAGGDVVIWGRRSESNAEAVRALRAHGRRAMAQSVDVADEPAVQTAFAAAVAAMGPIDGVVVNAGINSVPDSFTSLTTAQYHELLGINLHGAYYTLRESVRHMRLRFDADGSGGSIVVCGSLSVVAGVPRLEHYAAAKGALMAITRSIAVEYGAFGIRANMVLPGRIMTNLGGQPAAAANERARVIPIPRLGTPDDCAGIVVYLLSDASRYQTGTMIPVDGGLSIALR